MQSSAYPLKLADVKKIIIAAPTFRDRCVIKSLFWLGLRREEITVLDIRDIEFQRRRVTVCGKGDKTRVVPVFDEETLSDLKHLIGDRKVGFVFQSEGNRQTFSSARIS